MDNRVVFLTAQKGKQAIFAGPRVVSVMEEAISEIIPANNVAGVVNKGLTKVKCKSSLATPYPGEDYTVYEAPLEIEAARNPASTDLYVKQAIDAALTAAGTVQGTALALTKYLNEITTNDVGTNDGVKLPAAVIGKVVVIINTNSAGAVKGALKVYPATGEFIDSLAVNINTTVARGARAAFVCPTTTGKWVTATDYTQG